jgi:alcohol dehydrogenase, propanol-preferring
VKAVQLVEWQAEPEIREVPVPEPGPGEVLVKVWAAGLCHSDLHVMEWPAGTLPYRLPFTLGHENAGVVAALGPGANGVEEGDAVLVYGPWGCGICWRCAQGSGNLCERAAERHGHGGGLGFDGGLAEYVVVPSASLLVPIGDLDPAQAAPLTDAALTPYHAIKSSLHLLRPGSAVVVIGVGGLGHVAIQLLKALTPSRVVAVDARRSAVQLALELGADAALASHEATADDVRAETGAGGATLVLDFVGVDETVALAAAVLGVGGHVAVVGVGGATFPLAFGSVSLEGSASIPNWGTLPELIELVALARSGALDIRVERLPLDDTLEGYGRLRAGEVAGRVVVVPGDGGVRERRGS